MSNDYSRPRPAGGANVPPWLLVVIFLAVLGYSFWQKSQSPLPMGPPSTGESQSTGEPDLKPLPENRLPDHEPPVPEGSRPTQHTPQPGRSDNSSTRKPYQIENQSIRDLNGKTIFQGTIDLTPTLDRIERGERNHHQNDGTSFQNREGRLPRQPANYYREYVHPTRGIHGPGPQRIIIGKEGDIWYTPDHYKTFRQIKFDHR